MVDMQAWGRRAELETSIPSYRRSGLPRYVYMRYVAQKFGGDVACVRDASGNSEFEISGQHIDEA